ncbi:bifunctional non-homologous end joining protein LigD [Amycolatopsis arida]|uniref:Bifunctional non-homologous end joining protein LigD n=1 Tax=Amycolatopsis arida TaxID=587909 RepID=A0A1I5YE33_9PSEU|nr:non-homologous end-joining DNA ligase [Amycolatopsis arida]TDX90450.1 bifunctional non-homologous end joining protein LigD [Amycolatopsis arida]SFQ42469.1 bifunctional non-homologous end joining protein LigD [Amycolatopsis arida]
MAERKIVVRVEDRRLTLTNLEKVLYPKTGFTKRDVIDYYHRIAPVLLPHLADRAATFVRFPDGVAGQSFFEKDVSRHAPDWVRTARLTGSGRRGEEVNDYPVIGDLPTLIWAANLAALELHVPQWTVGPRGARRPPDLLVFDLDPGAPATVVQCCRVAERLREVLADDGLVPVPKTSGGKGMQLYCAVRTRKQESTSDYAKRVAELLAGEQPDLIVAKMQKALRPGKVFIDWSQNNPAKTTVAPYSLRGRERPTVSTPITWDEVESCRRVDDLVFTAPDVLDRVDELGDLFEEVHERPAALPRR